MDLSNDVAPDNLELKYFEAYPTWRTISVFNNLCALLLFLRAQK